MPDFNLYTVLAALDEFMAGRAGFELNSRRPDSRYWRKTAATEAPCPDLWVTAETLTEVDDAGNARQSEPKLIVQYFGCLPELMIPLNTEGLLDRLAEVLDRPHDDARWQRAALQVCGVAEAGEFYLLPAWALELAVGAWRAAVAGFGDAAQWVAPSAEVRLRDAEAALARKREAGR